MTPNEAIRNKIQVYLANSSSRMKILLLLNVIVFLCKAYPERGLWRVHFSSEATDSRFYFSKSMFSKTIISLSEVKCKPINASFALTWQLYYSKRYGVACFPSNCPSFYEGQKKEETVKLQCSEAGDFQSIEVTSGKAPISFTTGFKGSGWDGSDGTTGHTFSGGQKLKPKESSVVVIAESWKDGEYFFQLQIIGIDGDTVTQSPKDWLINALIETRDSNGHLLSAADFPCLSFYLILVLLYVFYGIFWLVMMAKYWEDMLRIQCFLGVIILIGLLEKIAFYFKYKHVDDFGDTIKSMVIVAELISIAKRTLFRAFLIVCSIGYGVVKPRLGSTLPKLLTLSSIYFIMASLEFTTVRLKRTPKESTAPLWERNSSYQLTKEAQLLVSLPLAACELGMVCWGFGSLIQTVKDLKWRKSDKNLLIYCYFIYLLINICFTSVGFLTWSTPRIHLAECVTDMREIWLDEGFWTIKFCFTLLIIMILWRPSLNSSSLLLNQPEKDEGDEVWQLKISEINSNANLK